MIANLVKKVHLSIDSKLKNNIVQLALAKY